MFPEMQYLENSQSDQFPYNIILPFQSNNDVNPLLYFVFSQTFAYENREETASFCKAGTVVLAANMESGLPSSMQKESFSGLRTFLNTAPSDAIFIIVSESDTLTTSAMEIIPGGNGHIADKTIIQTLIQSSQDSGFSPSIQSFLLTFYRLNCVEGSPTAGLCLENGFQSAEIIVSKKADPDLLSDFAVRLLNELDSFKPQEGTHYSLINTGSQVLSISENLYTVVLFIILSVTLLGSCLFSFMFGKQKTANRAIFLKWWYVGPLLILIVFLLTLLSEQLTVTLFTAYTIHPGYALFIKLSFITLFFLLVCEIRYIIPLPETDYLYSFFMMLASALVVFMYTSIDMPLLLPFCLEYIVFLISRPIKKWWFNTCILIAEIFPLFFVFNQAAPYLINGVFISFTQAPPIFSLFTAAILLPYLLMMIRIFIGSGIWNAKKGKKRIIIETGILCFLLLLLCLFSTFCFRDEAKTVNLRDKLEAPFMTSANKLHIVADAQSENGMVSFTISCTDDIDVLRYDISVASEAVIPVYSANLPFSFSEMYGKASFNLDENPCNPFIITGLLPATLPVEITITAYQNDRETLLYEVHSVVFEEENTGKNRQIRTIIK